MNKSVVITGAYGGMGRATVRALAKEGYRVFAIDKIIPFETNEENVIPIAADVTVEESVSAAFDKISLMADDLYAVIHFAGIYMLDSLVEMEREDFEKIFKVNLEGAYLINRAAMPFLKSGSRILITTSELAPLDPLPFTGIYGITKAALDKYAYSLRMELQLKGVSVSVLRAGAVDTGMLGVSTDALDGFYKKTKLYTYNAERFKRIVERVEARRISPEKIGERAAKIINKKHPKFAYAINRNPLLLLLNALPKRLQLFIIRQVLKTKKGED